MRRIRRVLLTALAYVVLGAVTAVLVAWGCCLLQEPHFGEKGFQTEGHYRRTDHGYEPYATRLYSLDIPPSTLMISISRKPGLCILQSWAYGPEYQQFIAGIALDLSDYRPGAEPQSLIPFWGEALVLPWDSPTRPWPKASYQEYEFIDARGWPWPCLYWRETLDASFTRSKKGAWELPVTANQSRIFGSATLPLILPYAPIAPTLCAEAAMYGLAWFGVVRLIRLSRRLRTRRMGLCTSCRYDLRGCAPGSPCPECGRALR